jgi:hypothetical protein
MEQQKASPELLILLRINAKNEARPQEKKPIAESERSFNDA